MQVEEEGDQGVAGGQQQSQNQLIEDAASSKGFNHNQGEEIFEAEGAAQDSALAVENAEGEGEVPPPETVIEA